MFLPILIVPFISIARAPGVLPFPVVFSILELALILMRFGFEHSISLKLAVEEISAELVTGVKGYGALAVFQVIDESALVGILTFLFQFALALIFLVFELSLVDLCLIGRDVGPSDQFIILEGALIGCIVEGKNTFSIGVVVPPLSFVGGSVLPGELSFSMFHVIFHLAFVDLPVFFDESSDAWTDGLQFGLKVELLRQQFEGLVAGVGETDGLSVGLVWALFLRLDALEGLALGAQRTIAHIIIDHSFIYPLESYFEKRVNQRVESQPDQTNSSNLARFP